MAAPHKGPRRGFQLKWPEETRQLVQDRAAAGGMTMTAYLLHLVDRDEVDADGRPTWVSDVPPADQLPLAATA